MNAPGQEEGAAPLPEGYEYPTMEQLAEQVRFRAVTCSPLHSRLQVQEVLNHFSLVRYIGIGIGLGANVLVRHALQVGVQIVKYLDQNLTLLRSQLKWLHHM